MTSTVSNRRNRFTEWTYDNFKPLNDTRPFQHRNSGSCIPFGQNNDNVGRCRYRPFKYCPRMHCKHWLLIMALLSSLLFLLRFFSNFFYGKQLYSLHVVLDRNYETFWKVTTQESELSNEHDKSPDLFINPTNELHSFATLYRIIGNDLPPRHSPAQTLRNLRFILENEQPFHGCQKVWILNRLVDTAKRQSIIELLNQYSQRYLEILFDEETYRTVEFRYDDFPQADFFYSNEYQKYPKHVQLLAIDHTYHDKNIYVMNNNGARNFALEHGRSVGAQWILPFDGNCFLTEESWREIRSELERYGASTKYFIIPMVRLTNNSVLLQTERLQLEAMDEPQIIFRHDATEWFNKDKRYGRRSKVELLWRLGVLGSWEQWKFLPWEEKRWLPSNDVGQFRKCSWVARLFSGRWDQEVKGASKTRSYYRLLAIQRFIDDLDSGILREAGFHSRRLVSLNEIQFSENQRQFWAGYPSMLQRMQIFFRSPSSSRHFDLNHNIILTAFLTMNTTDALKMLRAVQTSVIQSAFMQYFTGSDSDGTTAKHLIQTWFTTELNSNQILKLVSRYQNDPKSGFKGSASVIFSLLAEPTNLFDFICNVTGVYDRDLVNMSQSLYLHTFFDAIRLLHSSKVLSSTEMSQLKLWVVRVQDYLLNYFAPSSSTSFLTRTFFDLQLAALSAFVDDSTMFLKVVDRSKMRAPLLVGYVSGMQTQLNMLKENDVSDEFTTLQYFATLLNLGMRNGVDVWSHITQNKSLAEWFKSLTETLQFHLYHPNLSRNTKLRLLTLLKSVPCSDSYKNAFWNAFYETVGQEPISDVELMRFGVDPFWYLWTS